MVLEVGQRSARQVPKSTRRKMGIDLTSRGVIRESWCVGDPQPWALGKESRWQIERPCA